jgi:ferredoxin
MPLFLYFAPAEKFFSKFFCPGLLMIHKQEAKMTDAQKLNWREVISKGLSLGLIAGGAVILGKPGFLLGVNHAQNSPPVTPPGSGNLAHFTQTCTACSLCISACPTTVLTPSFLDYGMAGLLQPKMNYEKSFCDYECNVCSRVCPTGAIRPISLDEKKAHTDRRN